MILVVAFAGGASHWFASLGCLMVQVLAHWRYHHLKLGENAKWEGSEVWASVRCRQDEERNRCECSLVTAARFSETRSRIEPVAVGPEAMSSYRLAP